MHRFMPIKSACCKANNGANSGLVALSDLIFDNDNARVKGQ
jgi:hypothetical protein